MILFISQKQHDIISDSLNVKRINLTSPLSIEVDEENTYISPRLGQKNTPEHIEKIKLSHLGRKRSKEVRENIRKAVKKTYDDGRIGKSGNKGKKFSEQTRELMSEKRKKYLITNGSKSGWRFRRNEETNNKLSKTTKGRFRVYREDGSWTWGYPSKANI